jgi:hypothetical protein
MMLQYSDHVVGEIMSWAMPSYASVSIVTRSNGDD